ncbi:MAG: hypothetical protein ACM3QS_13945 [Bacteroidota bacterium]
MNSSVGGLFKTEENLRLASEGLRKAGFEPGAISVLTRKPKNAPVHSDRAQAPDVARGALIGAGVLAVLAGLLGLLIGLGVVPIPGVDAATYRISMGFVLTSVLAGVLAGAATGAILGAATRLLFSKDKAAITSRGVKRGGLLLVASVEDSPKEALARQIMEQNGAVDLQNLTEKWDRRVWSDFDELPQPRRE